MVLNFIGSYATLHPLLSLILRRFTPLTYIASFGYNAHLLLRYLNTPLQNTPPSLTKRETTLSLRQINLFYNGSTRPRAISVSLKPIRSLSVLGHTNTDLQLMFVSKPRTKICRTIIHRTVTSTALVPLNNNSNTLSKQKMFRYIHTYYP